VTGAWLASLLAQIADSPTVVQQTHPSDSVVVESPLPGGAAEVARFLLNTVPQWVQIGGVFVAAIVALAVVAVLFRRRRAISTWIMARDRSSKILLASVAGVLLVVILGAGAATWNYTQHSNAFCTGCHVMKPAFQKFAEVANKHADLSCHECHQQPISASIHQMYMWVAERPEKIGSHTKLENQVCERCHVTGDTARWQHIRTTAGHRVHLESDSASLKDLQCVTCHGAEVHSFKPVIQTCGQSGCHSSEDTDIVLGKMATQTNQHCLSCHQFTADVPALATRDSARATLIPGSQQCQSCHEMRGVLGEFVEGKDPHAGKCGSCHNPHTQKTPAAAAATCATAGCHANWKDEPFHMGASHRRVAGVANRCITCHVPHQAKVDASDCQGCHESVRARGGLRPPVRFDTSAALRRRDTTTVPRVASPPDTEWRHAAPANPPLAGPVWSHRGGPFALDPGDSATPFTPDLTTSEEVDSDVRFSALPAADTFPHARHVKLACLVCHQTGSGPGRLTFERPRGCSICHHQAPGQAKCETCHRTEQYGQPRPKPITVTVPGHQPSARNVDFVHAQHSARPCLECHTTPVTLALAPAKAQCQDCHVEHHAVERTCASCHRVAEARVAHPTPEIAHQRCDACHTRATIERLTPTRSFCSTCHAPKATNHYEPRECTVCHFLTEPAAYRSRLITPPPT
jgi:hypothetical protein